MLPMMDWLIEDDLELARLTLAIEVCAVCNPIVDWRRVQESEIEALDELEWEDIRWAGWTVP